MTTKKWFFDTLLPSLLEQMKANKKYPHSMIISDRQAELCRCYFSSEQHGLNSWGYFPTTWVTSYRCHTDGVDYSLETRGKYTILHYYLVATEAEKKEIQTKIDAIDAELDRLDSEYQKATTEEERQLNNSKVYKLETEAREWECKLRAYHY